MRLRLFLALAAPILVLGCATELSQSDEHARQMHDAIELYWSELPHWPEVVLSDEMLETTLKGARIGGARVYVQLSEWTPNRDLIDDRCKDPDEPW